MTDTVISPILHDVLCNWIEQADEAYPVTREYGLCEFAHRYGGWSRVVELRTILKKEFAEHYLFPFDATSMDYHSDHHKHLNPRRHAWVLKKIGQYKESLNASA